MHSFPLRGRKGRVQATLQAVSLTAMETAMPDTLSILSIELDEAIAAPAAEADFNAAPSSVSMKELPRD